MKSCQHCDHWVDCDKGYGLCIPFSELTGGEYDVFTNPDDKACVQFFTPLDEDE